jgi:phosphoenolpyruvate carboxylase
MNPPVKICYEKFNQRVRNRYNLYNSIFLNLPFKDISSFGSLIPVMTAWFQKGLLQGKEPVDIVNSYFKAHTELRTEKEKIDFMFRVIQYIERQVVLYDSIEDSAFPYLHDSDNKMTVFDYIHLGEERDIGNKILDKLATFGVRMVFTAHPTQFYPPAVLEIISRLKSLIDENDINGIDLTLQQLGMTSLMNEKKPTPLDEARNILYFLRNLYYDSIGELYGSIKKSLPESTELNPGLFRLGFWPGGDRDGNPFVTAKTTLMVADELRMTLMKCYYRDLRDLEKKLTFREVTELLGGLIAHVYKAMFDPAVPVPYEKLLDTLLEIKSVIVSKYNGIYREELEQVIDKVRIFRTHFATLDIRQDHSVHKIAVEAILSSNQLISTGLEELKSEDLTEILMGADVTIRLDRIDDEQARDTVRNIMQLKRIQERNGEWGCNRYIISNSEDIYSVLFVFALFRWSGWRDPAFDIVPLFETMTGMERAPAIMQELFGLPEYHAHLQRRNFQQTMMLGFSDGTKDGGYLKANWSIFKAKENLTEVCDRQGIAAIFFDGRGGTPARGGGKTHRFYAAQSPRIANHEIQLTIQGQTISSRYGTKEQFLYNCDQLLTAGLSNAIYPDRNSIRDHHRDMIEELSGISYQKYLALKSHEKFLPYLENKSTLKYYSRAKVGSRPARRGKSGKLELTDLRAISFVGSWSQLKQNVPGYFGIGTALDTFVQNGRLEELRELFRSVRYFRALVLNSMMSLSKTNFNLTAYLGKDPEYSDFWNVLHDEYILSKEMLLLVSGYETLMEEEPVTKCSIEVREQIVLPLLVIQQYALQRVEHQARYKSSYEKLIERSLYGNINASRNSA